MRLGGNMKHKIKIAALSAALLILAALGIFLCVWFFGARYPEFDAAVQKEGEIPGLSDGISPQGLCPLPLDSGYRFAMSGYIKGEPSRVYLFGGENSPKYVTLKDGSKDVDTHFGGITCTGNYLVVASGKRLVRFPLAEALSAENGAAVALKDGFTVKGFRSVAYCYFYDGMLYAGEFYRPGNYETDQSHHIAVADGETNFGIVYAYRADESAAGGVASETPEYAISVREQVQGFAVWEGGIVLSTSYGLPDSRLWFYRPLGEPSGQFEGVPLYILGESDLNSTFGMPCMSEEIFVQEGRLYILFESKSKQYRQFVRRQIGDVLSVSLGAEGIGG